MTEQELKSFISECAARGWSKNQTAAALNMDKQKFWAILKLLPEMKWVGRGSTLANKLGNESKKGVHYPKVIEAAKVARKAWSDQRAYTVGGHIGSVVELAKLCTVSARTIYRRLAAGQPPEQAFTFQRRYVRTENA